MQRFPSHGTEQNQRHLNKAIANHSASAALPWTCAVGFCTELRRSKSCIAKSLLTGHRPPQQLEETSSLHPSSHWRRLQEGVAQYWQARTARLWNLANYRPPSGQGGKPRAWSRGLCRRQAYKGAEQARSSPTHAWQVTDDISLQALQALQSERDQGTPPLLRLPRFGQPSLQTLAGPFFVYTRCFCKFLSRFGGSCCCQATQGPPPSR